MNGLSTRFISLSSDEVLGRRRVDSFTSISLSLKQQQQRRLNKLILDVLFNSTG